MLYRFDLHIHSCLSPCGDLRCSPSAIARAAKAAGLNGVMLSDHNTSRNCPAFSEACTRAGLACLFGLEIATAEELHALAAFDTLEQARQMTELIYAALPTRSNDPAVFGDQPIVNVADEIESMEERLLSAPCSLSVSEVGMKIHELGGLFIASHVDRPVFSVFSQLGGLSGQEGFDAVELTCHAAQADWTAKLHGLPILRSSDAHDLDAIGRIWNEVELEQFTTSHLKNALQQDRVRNGVLAVPGIRQQFPDVAR